MKMTAYALIATLSTILCLPFAANAQQTSQTTPASSYTKEQILESWGWSFTHDTKIAPNLNLSAEEVQAFARGMLAASQGKPAPEALDKIGPEIEVFLKTRQQAFTNQIREKTKQENDLFFADLKKKPHVQVLPSGLAYEILSPGKGPFPKSDQIVKIDYIGSLLNGTVFDSTKVTGKPFESPLDAKIIIPGWREGLTNINKGGKIKLYIPPSLACGEKGAPGIPPNSTLIFEITLLDIKNAPIH